MNLKMTGKQRALRVPLTHHQRKDELVRSRLTWTLIATVLAAAYFFIDLIPNEGGTGDERYSRGPVAAVHATWEKECDACHIDFVPIRSDAWASTDGWLASLLPETAGDDPARASDKKCMSCHKGPAHHSNEKASDIQSCAHCHLEHKGREFALARTEDAKCIECHSDLIDHIGGDSIYPDDPIEHVVLSFASSHPKFRSIKTDPGKIKFPHERHLTAGISLASETAVS